MENLKEVSATKVNLDGQVKSITLYVDEVNKKFHHYTPTTSLSNSLAQIHAKIDRNNNLYSHKETCKAHHSEVMEYITKKKVMDADLDANFSGVKF